MHPVNERMQYGQTLHGTWRVSRREVCWHLLRAHNRQNHYE